jgi:hypothetical protein
MFKDSYILPTEFIYVFSMIVINNTCYFLNLIN